MIAKKTIKRKSKNWNEVVKKKNLKEDQIGSIDVEEKARQRRQSLRRQSQDGEGKQKRGMFIFQQVTMLKSL